MQTPAVLAPEPQTEGPPDHTQLPDEDGKFVHNFQEHPQSELLTACLQPRLRELHPDGQFCIGCDSGIYWKHTKEPLDGCKAPDWFYVPGVPPMLEGELRHSYVMWEEVIAPLVVVEYVSGDGSDERNTTPHKGKFWVYEQGIRADFYAIYEVQKAAVELYRLENRRYQPVQANAAGRFLIEPLRVGLGIWQGVYRGMDRSWLRVWDATSGRMLPTPEEHAEAERERAETAESLLDDTRRRLDEECERAETERRRAEKLAERLPGLGFDPDASS